MNPHQGRIAVFGAGGQVGQALMAAVGSVDLTLRGFTRADADITDPAAIERVMTHFRPHVIINGAAYTDVNGAERAPNEAMAINRDGAAVLAGAAAKKRAALIHLSTEYVFAGDRETPYDETAPPRPLNHYGASKLAGEEKVRAALPDHVIVRTSCVFSNHGRSFLRRLFLQGSDKKELPMVSDQITGPTPANVLAMALLTIAAQLINGKRDGYGTFHYCGAPATSFYGLAKAAFEGARQYGFKPPVLLPVTMAEYRENAASQPAGLAKRPAKAVLSCARIADCYGLKAADWRSGLAAMLESAVQSAAATRQRARA